MFAVGQCLAVGKSVLYIHEHLYAEYLFPAAFSKESPEKLQRRHMHNNWSKNSVFGLVIAQHITLGFIPYAPDGTSQQSVFALFFVFFAAAWFIVIVRQLLYVVELRRVTARKDGVFEVQDLKQLYLLQYCILAVVGGVLAVLAALVCMIFSLQLRSTSGTLYFVPIMIGSVLCWCLFAPLQLWLQVHDEREHRIKIFALHLSDIPRLDPDTEEEFYRIRTEACVDPKYRLKDRASEDRMSEDRMSEDRTSDSLPPPIQVAQVEDYASDAPRSADDKIRILRELTVENEGILDAFFALVHSSEAIPLRCVDTGTVYQ
jgi:hypothetical protein